MLPSSQRLRRNTVEYLFRKGGQVRNFLFIAKYRFNNQLENRFSVIVSKKIHRKATARNHLRRQIYEAIRHNENSILLNNKTIDCIIIATPKTKASTYQEINQGITSLLKRIK